MTSSTTNWSGDPPDPCRTLGLRGMLAVRGAARVTSSTPNREMSDSIIILLAILITANILLIALAILRNVQRGRRERHETTARPVATAARPVSGANGTAASVDRAPAAATAAVAADSRGAPPRTDPLTGLLRQTEWERILIDEAARIDRYGRPATVVFIDVEGLDKLTSVLGPAAGDRILPALASVLAGQARGSDHVARLGPGRFGVLLTETGEVEAVNYVERVRSACELWLESGAIAMRLAVGWAAPPPDGSLADAFALAQDRMFAELRRGERRAADLAPERQTVGPRLRGLALPGLNPGQSVPCRRARPGSAPVWTPSATTGVPATITCSMPIGKLRGAS